MRSFRVLNKSRLLFLFPVIIACSCALRQTEVIVEYDNPLRFVISGSGLVDYFSVNCHYSSKNTARMCWQIAPLEDTDIATLRKLGPIVYGKVPTGFRQVIPEGGEPEPIRENSDTAYSVTLAIRNGGGVNKLFAVRDGKIVAERE